MKTAIADYLLPSADEKIALWDTSVFVFDTNVLLNLYRYTRPTREALLAALVEMADRVWLPHQVAEEYAKHRHEIIFETEEKYKSIGKQASDFVDAIQKELRFKSDDSALSNLRDMVFHWIEEQKTQNILAKSASDDPIIFQLLSIFDGKVGPALSPEEMAAIHTEGKERYEKQIPPGYCDAKKEKDNPSHNAYGDLIVWKQIMAFASAQKKNVIFVTHDQKEDWWLISKGRTIGPRLELTQEFKKQTSQQFYMYNMEGFLRHIAEQKGHEANPDVLEEIINVTRLSQMHLNPGDFGLTSFKTSGITRQLSALQEKNERRKAAIEGIKEKYRDRRMPTGVATQLKNTERLYSIDERKMSELLEKLLSA